MPTDRQTDGRASERYVMLSARHGQAQRNDREHWTMNIGPIDGDDSHVDAGWPVIEKKEFCEKFQISRNNRKYRR